MHGGRASKLTPTKSNFPQHYHICTALIDLPMHILKFTHVS
jgi:hypothetical protein